MLLTEFVLVISSLIIMFLCCYFTYQQALNRQKRLKRDHDIDIDFITRFLVVTIVRYIVYTSLYITAVVLLFNYYSV